MYYAVEVERKWMMKRILVIGATSGIGRALVECLRGRGCYEVVACGRREGLLKELGGEWFVLDATAEDAVEKIAAVGADTVIFNAGYGERSGVPDWERTRRAIDLNVVAFERVAQWALTHCEVFAAVASIAGIRGLEDTNGYSASKAYMLNALEGYRRKARHGGYGCRYVSIVPGFVDTAMGGASNFWKCLPGEAACCILKGLERAKPVIYVTQRWRWIAWLMRWMPRGLFERIPLTVKE